jgi:nucleoid-associated protein YgaU
MEGNAEVAEGQALRAGSDWFQWYVIKRRDTLSEIALWWFGRPQERWWRRIWLANRRTIGENPNQIEAGDWLKLPYLGFSYHIESGDTLSQLAEWVYGNEDRWPRIHDANPWIRDPDDIQASWWIWIP